MIFNATFKEIKELSLSGFIPRNNRWDRQDNTYTYILELVGLSHTKIK